MQHQLTHAQLNVVLRKTFIASNGTYQGLFNRGLGENLQFMYEVSYTTFYLGYNELYNNFTLHSQLVITSLCCEHECRNSKDLSTNKYYGGQLSPRTGRVKIKEYSSHSQLEVTIFFKKQFLSFFLRVVKDCQNYQNLKFFLRD